MSTLTRVLKSSAFAMRLAARSSTSRASEYRNIKTAFSTDRVCPPHATLLPLVPAPDVGPPPSHRPPWRAPPQGVPEAPRATGRHPAPQGTDRTAGWGRAAGAAGGAVWPGSPRPPGRTGCGG